MDEKEPAGDHPAEKRISRYPPSFFLSAWLSWDGQKALPSRCLGRPRCRSTPAPAFRPPSLAAGETKCNARLPRRSPKKKGFLLPVVVVVVVTARSRRAIGIRITKSMGSRTLLVSLFTGGSEGELGGYGHARIRWKDSRRKFVIVFLFSLSV